MAVEVFEIGIRDELVEVLHPGLVLHKDDLVVGFQLQGVRLLRHGVVEAGDVPDAVLLEALDHAAEDHREHFGVVAGAVMIEVAEAVVLRERVEAVVLEFRVHVAGHGHGVEVGIRKIQPVLLRRRADEARVEGGVVGDEHAVSDEGIERLQRFSDRRRVRDHRVGDPGELGDVLRDVHAGVDEGVKAVEDLAVLENDRADLGDFVRRGGEARRLDIEDGEFVVEGDVLAPVGRAGGVVDVVRLDAVEDLDLVLELVRGEHGDGKALEIAVVRDRDGAVTPSVRRVHDVVGLVRRVHRGHDGVQMQLDPFLRRAVRAGVFLHLQDIGELHVELFVKLIGPDRPAHGVLLPLREERFGVVCFLCRNGDLDIDRRLAVGDGDREHHLIAAPRLLLFDGEDLAEDDGALFRMPDRPEGLDVFDREELAEDDLGRGTVEGDPSAADPALSEIRSLRAAVEKRIDARKGSLFQPRENSFRRGQRKEIEVSFIAT